MFIPGQPYNQLPLLPPDVDLETVPILKSLAVASRELAKLAGVDMLSDAKISLLVMEPLLVPESVSSNDIEGIHTTVKDFFDAQAQRTPLTGNNKEVQNYKSALLWGFDKVREREALITNDIVQIQAFLEPDKPGIQSSPSKAIVDTSTGQALYTPPQGKQLLYDLMTNLENYMNRNDLHHVDPLIKMAIIHYQFEAIHPFLDGNGRTGRILMILYLVHAGLLDLPILYLSGYINRHKLQYYSLLNGVKETNDRSSYIIYMLDAVTHQARHTTDQLVDIYQLIQSVVAATIEVTTGKISQSFVMTLFEQPFCTVSSIAASTGLHRNTVAKYFDILHQAGILIVTNNKKNYKTRSVKGFREILQRV